MVNQIVYRALIEVAKLRLTIPFADLGRAANMTIGGSDDDTTILGMALETISAKEATDGRPLLPVVVVHAENNMPGVRFFKFARQRKLQVVDDQTFFASELKRVHDHWANTTSGRVVEN